MAGCVLSQADLHSSPIVCVSLAVPVGSANKGLDIQLLAAEGPWNAETMLFFLECGDSDGNINTWQP